MPEHLLHPLTGFWAFTRDSMCLMHEGMGLLKKRCKTYGCKNLHRNVSGYCDECTEKWRKAHPRKDDKRPSASARGYDSRWTKFAKDYLKLHPVCAICGQPATCVDHKDIPADVMLDMWGSFDYDPSHYQALCTSCNTRKGNREDKLLRQTFEDDKQSLSALAQGGVLKNCTPSQTAFGGTGHTHEGGKQ